MRCKLVSGVGKSCLCGMMMLAMLWSGTELRAQKSANEKGGSDKDVKVKATPNGSKSERSKYRRLPPYFNEVVTPDQRDKIYALQEQYAERLKKLQEDMYALQAKREEEIDAILSADQRQRVMELAARAKANRKSAKPTGDANSTAADVDSQP